MAELITVTLAANETKQFRKAGSYFEIIDSSYALSLAFYTTNGSQTNSLNGALSGLFLDIDFGAFDIRNGATAQTVTLLVCDAGELGGSRRQPGVVQVVDSGKTTTLSGLAFMANGSNVANAAQFGSVQLYNPASSGRRVVVESVTINNTAAGANVYGVGFSGSTLQYTGGGSGAAQNKLAGGGLPAAVVNQKSDHAADPVALLPQSVLTGGSLAAGAQIVYVPKRPLVLPPGYGLMVIDRTANSSMGALFEFYEESA